MQGSGLGSSIGAAKVRNLVKKWPGVRGPRRLAVRRPRGASVPRVASGGLEFRQGEGEELDGVEPAAVPLGPYLFGGLYQFSDAFGIDGGVLFGLSDRSASIATTIGLVFGSALKMLRRNISL
jgi:hypothetical protein